MNEFELEKSHLRSDQIVINDDYRHQIEYIRLAVPKI